MRGIVEIIFKENIILIYIILIVYIQFLYLHVTTVVTQTINFYIFC